MIGECPRLVNLFLGLANTTIKDFVEKLSKQIEYFMFSSDVPLPDHVVLKNILELLETPRKLVFSVQLVTDMMGFANFSTEFNWVSSV